jgi:hypothetical protein
MRRLLKVYLVKFSGKKWKQSKVLGLKKNTTFTLFDIIATLATSQQRYTLKI